MRHFTGKLLFFALLSVCLAHCNKDDAASQKNVTPGNIPGMGRAGGELQGTAYTFPSGIEIKDGIKGDIFLSSLEGYCQKRGSGAFVLLQLNLINHTGKDTILVLPAGLTFHSKIITDQNGIIIQDVRIPLSDNDTCNTLVYAYCVNEHRDASGKSSRYEFGPVTNAKPLLSLIRLLENKNIAYSSNDADTYIDIKHGLQSAVWHITDGKGLTEEDQVFIQSITER